jgi:phosphoglycolate phosphatase
MTKSLPLYFDLDGPLLDVSEKYYRLHGAIVRRAGHAVEPKAQFWSMKRQRVPLTEHLYKSYPGLDEEAYLKSWLAHIETPAYLLFDTVVPGAAAVLEELLPQYQLHLVTLRRNQASLHWELRALGLHKFFVHILSGHSDAVPGWRVKANLIRNAGFAPAGSAIVGDTEADILAGKALGLVTIAVTNGIRSEDVLRRENPQFVIPDITALPVLLQRCAEPSGVAKA